MIELHRFTTDKDLIINGLKKRNWSESHLDIVDQIAKLDDQRKNFQTKIDSLRAEVNQLSAEIGALFKSGKKEEAEDFRAKVGATKAEVDRLEQSQSDVLNQLDDLLLSVPNIPASVVPPGKHAEDNEVYKPHAGDLPTLYDNSVPHWDLADKYGLIDFSLGAKITGSGFPLYRGQGAKLQRALINFFLDEAISAGYEEIIPPHLVNAASARGTGALPDKEGQMYHMEKDGFYLIPTAEVPITNIFRDVILQEEDLPVRLCGYTPCFRREAGSYGNDVKGLNRVHQFDKIEIVHIEHPDQSYKALEGMLNHVSGLLDKLQLPYRILRLCGGDMSFASALTYDFEVYSAAQQRWLEVSSVSNFETFQSNRMKARFRDSSGKTQLTHTLNGSALALARIVAALLENNQTADGIVIPPALVPYTRFDIIK